MPREGEPLPESTRVVVLQYEALQAHTLPNADMSRGELSRRIVDQIEAEGERPPLGPAGTTPWTVAPTTQSGTVYYLLAETPDGTLYESYVNTGRGFVPGFDAVQSGRMTMGPVPESTRSRMRSALQVGRESRSDTTADTDADSAGGASQSSAADTTAPADTTSSADTSSSEDTTSDAATPPSPSSSSGPSPSAAAPDSSSGSGIGGIVLGVLGGALLGGAGVWWWLSVRLRRLEEERADLQRTLRERENEAFRDAPSADDPPTGTDTETDQERLQALEEENAELRERNETLKAKITEIKEHLRALRDAE
jgi:hypothetical protein